MTEARTNIRAAASVLVLRDSASGPQVLLMRRPERDNDFRSGACVFPGGVLDRADADVHRWCLGVDDAAASARLGLAQGGLDYFVAALRECFEEVGLLFACRADASAPDLAAHTDALHTWRSRLHRGEATLAQLCEAFDWRLDLREMAYFAHWLTPVTRPKRFDTRFFMRLAPPGQEAQPDFGEALELMWLTPDEALDPQRGLKLLNVTQRVLHDLRHFTSTRAAFDHALASRGVARILPRPAQGRGGPRFVIEGDPSYDEVARLDPDGRGDVRCELVPGDVVRLSPRIWRVTGEVANAYAVASPESGGVALIDADAGDPRQLQALARLAGRPTDSAVQLLSSCGTVTHRLGDLLREAGLCGSIQVPAVGQGRLRLGPDTTLRSITQEAPARLRLGWLLEEESTLMGMPPIGQGATMTSALAAAAEAAQWIAPAKGFIARSTTLRY